MIDRYDAFLAKEGGAMGVLIRDHDWSEAGFGPVASWGRSLRSALAMCLTSPAISTLFWGPDLRLLYNDAYALVLAEKHPGALGASGRRIWTDWSRD